VWWRVADVCVDSEAEPLIDTQNDTEIQSEKAIPTQIFEIHGYVDTVIQRTEDRQTDRDRQRDS
jgi:hypothetical protein